MDLSLNDDDVVTLREMLRDYLPQVEREAARTAWKPLRHELVKRQTLCERLLTELGGQRYPASSLE
jgi:hypothetical protein